MRNVETTAHGIEQIEVQPIDWQDSSGEPYHVVVITLKGSKGDLVIRAFTDNAYIPVTVKDTRED